MKLPPHIRHVSKDIFVCDKCRIMYPSAGSGLKDFLDTHQHCKQYGPDESTGTSTMTREMPTWIKPPNDYGDTW